MLQHDKKLLSLHILTFLIFIVFEVLQCFSLAGNYNIFTNTTQQIIEHYDHEFMPPLWILQINWTFVLCFLALYHLYILRSLFTTDDYFRNYLYQLDDSWWPHLSYLVILCCLIAALATFDNGKLWVSFGLYSACLILGLCGGIWRKRPAIDGLMQTIFVDNSLYGLFMMIILSALMSLGGCLTREKVQGSFLTGETVGTFCSIVNLILCSLWMWMEISFFRKLFSGVYLQWLILFITLVGLVAKPVGSKNLAICRNMFIFLGVGLTVKTVMYFLNKRCKTRGIAKI